MSTAIFEHVRDLAMTLTPEEQVCLIGDLAAKLRGKYTPPEKKPFRSLYGALKDLGPAPSAEDIDESTPRSLGQFPARGHRQVIRTESDTHALIWYLWDDPRWSLTAKPKSPVDRTIIPSLASIDRSPIPDVPDRIIAATAVPLGVPQIRRDGKLRSSSVRTIW